MRSAVISTLGAALLASCGAPLGRPSPAPGAPAPPLRVATPAAQSVAPQPLPEAPAADSKSIGTAHPLIVEASAPNGGWTVLCQARRDSNGDGRISVQSNDLGVLSGDELQSYLVLGSGEGVEIDELASVSPDGSWLVTKRAGRLSLLDLAARSSLDLSALGADARSDAASFRDHRALAFNPTSTHLAYVRSAPGPTAIVVRELATGVETAIDAGGLEVWRIAFDPSGRWLTLHVIPSDTNKNGRLDWPVPEVAENRWRCQGPIARMAVWPDHGDREERRFVPVQGGPLQRVDGVLAPCGNGFLLRNDKDELLLQADNQLRLLEPSRCAARLLHADCTRDALIVACTGSKARRPPLELVGTSYRLPLGVDVAPTGQDELTAAPAGSRFVPLSSGQTPIVVDLESRRSIALKPGDVTVAAAADNVLIRRGERLLLWNLTAQTESLLPGELTPLGDLLRAGDTLLLEPLIVDVRHARLLGTAPENALALSVDGRVLTAAAPAVPGASLATGPVTWIAPKPPPAEATSAL